MNKMKEQRAGGYLIAKIHRISRRIFAKMMRDNNIEEINPAQGRILFTLWKNEGMSIVELGKETGLSKSTLTTMLDRLKVSGHIEMKKSEKDKRKINIFITEKNKQLQKSYDTVSQKMIDLTYKGFTKEEIDIFENNLERILENFEKKK